MATQQTRRIGRPPKLTPEVHGAVITAIRSGRPACEAAQTAAISPETIRAWAKTGRNPDAREELREFAEAIARARAEAAEKAVTREDITGADGRVTGTRITRRLRNRRIEITEEFTRPDRRKLLAQARAAGQAGALEVLFGLGGS